MTLMPEKDTGLQRRTSATKMKGPQGVCVQGERGTRQSAVAIGALASLPLPPPPRFELAPVALYTMFSHLLTTASHPPLDDTASQA